jgi:hypothetical protein
VGEAQAVHGHLSELLLLLLALVLPLLLLLVLYCLLLVLPALWSRPAAADAAAAARIPPAFVDYYCLSWRGCYDRVCHRLIDK